MIIHFDVDDNINMLLSGIRNKNSLTQKTALTIFAKEKITAVTIKSQSIITKEVLDKLPDLKLIITRTAGTDNIDLQTCKAKGIAVYNIPDYGAQNIAQHAIALLLCLARKIITANLDTHQGNFSYKNYLGMSLVDKIFGVIGTGRIGLEVIKIAKSMGMQIIAYDVYENKKAQESLGFKYVTFDFLLKNADVISLHAPNTKETKHLIDKKKIKLIKTNAILINTARGELIEEKALIENIRKFWGVGLDVLEEEAKFSSKHPLLKFSNVIITPHCAFYTDESVKVIAKETMENIRRYRIGDRTNRLV